MRRLNEVQEDLADLIPDLRTFEHYSEIEDVGWALRILQRLKTKYEKFETRGVWDES